MFIFENKYNSMFPSRKRSQIKKLIKVAKTATAHKPEVKTPRSGDPVYLNFMGNGYFKPF